jgi:hypothetical protein
MHLLHEQFALMPGQFSRMTSPILRQSAIC